MALDRTIDKEDIRKGDKIKVTYDYRDAEYSRTGIAHSMDFDCDWKTEAGIYLNMTGASSRQNQVIELLERAKTAEEILEERRDALAAQFSHGSITDYSLLTILSQRAVDHIILLEDEKEALVN